MEKYTKLADTLDQFIEGTCYKTWEGEIASMDTSNIDNKLDMCILTWSENSTNELPQSINHPLFSKRRNGLLESNFDSELHKVIAEGSYWAKIMALGIISLSYNVNKLLQKKDSLRLLRENVMLIVRDYNNIKMTISDDETKLFAEHLSFLENQIAPGIKKFNWGSYADNFVQSCRGSCKNVYAKVKKFQTNVQKI
jgi:dynein heavy chain